jgi:hypothetical protein
MPGKSKRERNLSKTKSPIPAASEVGQLIDLAQEAANNKKMKSIRATTITHRFNLYNAPKQTHTLHQDNTTINHNSAICLIDGTIVKHYKVQHDQLRYSVMIGTSKITYAVHSILHIPIHPKHRLAFYKNVQQMGWTEFTSVEWNIILKWTASDPTQYFVFN